MLRIKFCGGRQFSASESPTSCSCEVLHYYKDLRLILRAPGLHRQLYIHKLVAEHFLPEKAEDQTFVIHLDFKKGNNKANNLKWANTKERIEHNRKSPAVIQAVKKLTEFNKQSDGRKLTAAKVQFIKK
ncbi:MAG: hypothetical protein M3Q58_04925 [Bacteroidota bacterium]|nr:hypothetical protein [Bacteroidota bacterium]